MDSRVLDTDPILGLTRIHHYDSATGLSHIETVADVTDVVEDAKARHASVDERARWGDMAHVARIPLTIINDLRAKGILDDQAAFKRWLNDPDNRVFRTRPGKV